MSSITLPPKTHYLNIAASLKETIYRMKNLAREHPLLALHGDIEVLERMLKEQQEYAEQCTTGTKETRKA